VVQNDPVRYAYEKGKLDIDGYETLKNKINASHL